MTPIRLEVDDVIYLRQDVNPHDLKEGVSELHSVLTEVLTDHEAAQYAAALLNNMGIPGVLLVPELEPGEEGPSEGEARRLSDLFYDSFTGAKRGRPFTVTSRVKPEVLSFNPDQMNFEALRRIPEERISAALGVPAILAGLGAGLEQATYSNASELREFFTEETLMPLWSMLAEEYTWQFSIPDFQAGQMRYDISKVAALQEDQNEYWERWLRALETGSVTVAEFRAAVGLDVNPGDDIYLRPPTVLEVPAALGTASPGEPEPQPEPEEEEDEPAVTS